MSDAPLPGAGDQHPAAALLTRYWPVLSLFAGLLTTLSFAPFDYSWLVFFSLALAFYLWQQLALRQAVISGFLFSLGLQCSGVSWIYYSLHVHGSAPAVFAALLIFLLCCYLSIYIALAVYVVKRYLPQRAGLQLMVFFPASWVVFEWLQGYVMTGFAWVQLGYTQIDLPLSGLAPIFGNHAVSGAVAITAGAVVMLLPAGLSCRREDYRSCALGALIVLGILWTSAALLKAVTWTRADGDAINVSVVQGNIAQKEKWKAYMKRPTRVLYRNLSLEQRGADLIVWPETAIPDIWYRVIPYIDQLERDMDKLGADLLLGIFVKDENSRLLNSVMHVGGHVYNKRHLVPLGEYIPLRSLIEFFNQFVKIPMSDISSGSEDQALLVAAGVPLGVSICFEDAFARDVIKDLPEAKILVNVSNDAWFEDSIEPHQHHAIARMRALESGRYLIRSTNTGITAIIGPGGEVISRLPQFEQAVLNAQVQPLSGATPFVRWGDGAIVITCSLILVVFSSLRRKRV